MYKKVNDLLDSFKPKNKDIIVLVGEYIKKSHIRNGESLDIKIKRSLQMIFDTFLFKKDKIALMSYSKNTKKIINLI